MGHALRQSYVPAKRNIKKTRKKSSRSAKKISANSFVNLFMAITVICFSIALVRVVQFAMFNQYALENEQISEQIDELRQVSGELANKKLALESPQRIEAIAKNKLKMEKPKNIRYIVYKKEVKVEQVAFLKR